LVLTAGLPWTLRSAFGLPLGKRRMAGSRSEITDRGHDLTGGSAAAATDEKPAQTPAPVPRRVLACHGNDCKRAGATSVWRQLREKQQGWRAAETGSVLQLTKTSCLGPCRFAPVVQVFPEGTYYGLLDGPALDKVVEGHLAGGRVVAELELPVEPKAGP
jgi:(2Fe-2S) ferredoxin